jgi:tRNA pseudouridine13 synthase
VKVKVRPEDFVVREQLRLRLKRAGAHSVYRLEKRNWNTLDVIDHLARRHGLKRLSRAGLKDRYALTVQYLSLPGSGPKLVREPSYSLRLVGRSDQPVTSELLSGNSFTITCRALSGLEADRLQANSGEVKRFGLPNYFDDQRFGSARHGQGFICRRLIDGHLNGALKLYLATPSPADPPAQRRQKTTLEQAWGDWPACARIAPSEAKPALSYLAAQPRDLNGALKRLPRDLLELFVNAYQSWLWNETVVALLRDQAVTATPVAYSQGELLFWRHLSPTMAAFLDRSVVPTVAPDAAYRSERVQRAANGVLVREGLDHSRLRLKVRIPGVYFKSFGRALVLRPEGLRLSETEPDEIYPGKLKRRLEFTLPPGAYATLVLKRLSLD